MRSWANRCCSGARPEGAVLALRDICPHRAAPLSAGRFIAEHDGGETVECPYHGWRFGLSGACVAIPSLTDADAFDLSRVKVRRYAVVESQGLVFIFIAEDPRETATPRRRRSSRAWSAARRSWSIEWISPPMSITPWWV